MTGTQETGGLMDGTIVTTVLGPVPANRLGTTVTHEHCLIDQSCWFIERDEASSKRDTNRPVEMSLLSDLRRRPFSTTLDNMLLTDEDLAIRELEHYRRAGGCSLVDTTCFGLGRDPLALQRIARASGLNIVMATGFYVERAHPGWVHAMECDELADILVKEVHEGAGDTGVKCGIIGEIGLSGVPKGSVTKTGAMTSQEEKTLRAAARASVRTGLTVSVHIDPREPRAAMPALDILEEEGVHPGRIIIDHMDQVHDFEYHRAVAARGVFVEYDSFGREHYSEEWGHAFDWGHDSWRVRFVEQLLTEGHGNQLLFSQDVCLKTDLRCFGGNGYSHVLRNVVPTLRALGVRQEAVERILIENPARAIGFVPLQDDVRPGGGR